jgi:2-polyprenyl-3-methyl-5-hydroxy-6-metoxy-1,4-benzoquinol methylase
LTGPAVGSVFDDRCLVCGDADFAPFADTPPGRWIRCGSCGLVRQLAPPPVAVTQKQYGFSSGHGDARAATWDLARRDAHVFFKYWIVGNTLSARKLSGRLVDVGCGAGLLQQYLATLGWSQTVGVEPSGDPTGREKLGLQVFSEAVGDFLERPGMAGGFDVAVANHVIEHCYEPAGLVGQMRELLRPGGHALIATPNLGGASMRWKTFASRRGWKSRPFRHLDYPKHLVLFDLENLARLIRAGGLEVIDIATYTRASGNQSKKPLRFGLWDRFGLGDNMLAVARRPLS